MATGFEKTDVDVDPDVVNRLIYEYLVSGVFSETAKSFGRACRLGNASKASVKTQGASSSNPAAAASHHHHNQGPSSSFPATSSSSGADKCMDLDSGSHDDPARGLAGEVDMMDTDESHPGCQSGPSANAKGGRPVGDLWAPEAAMRTLEARKHLYGLVTSGKINDAISFCNSQFPTVLSGSTPQSVDVCFQLQCQHFIECVKTSAEDALKFVLAGG
ncbi:hypothetical protein HK101_006856 [Irineochytrium annulatum]|nr:hypothetical protein HK101_006856 [Irineochytrium annulatum]